MNNHVVLEPSEPNVQHLKDPPPPRSVPSLAQGHLCACMGKKILVLLPQNVTSEWLAFTVGSSTQQIALVTAEHVFAAEFFH